MSAAGLGALGSFAGGISSGIDAEARRRLLALQAQQLQDQQSGRSDAGAALMSQAGVTPPTSVVPGATPMGQGGLLGGIKSLFSGGQQPQGAAQPAPLAGRGGGPQAPAMPPPSAAPQGPSQGQPSPQPGGPQGPPPPAAQAAVQKMDFPTLTNTLAKTPGMTPQRLMSALSALAPYMNMQAQMDYKQAMMRVAQQNANTNATVRPEMADTARRNADTNERRETDTHADRDARIKLETEKFSYAKESAKEKLDLAAGTSDEKTRTALLESARKELSALQAARNNARQIAGDDNDPTVKDLDAQIAEAKGAFETARQAAGNRPTGNTRSPDGGKSDARAQGPAPGTVVKGFRFKGGDPGKQESWEPVSYNDGGVNSPNPKATLVSDDLGTRPIDPDSKTMGMSKEDFNKFKIMEDAVGSKTKKLSEFSKEDQDFYFKKHNEGLDFLEKQMADTHAMMQRFVGGRGREEWETQKPGGSASNAQLDYDPRQRQKTNPLGGGNREAWFDILQERLKQKREQIYRQQKARGERGGDDV